LPLQGDGLCVSFPIALRWIVTHCSLRGEEIFYIVVYIVDSYVNRYKLNRQLPYNAKQQNEKKKQMIFSSVSFFQFSNQSINQLDDLFSNNNYSQTGKHGGTHGWGL
jgi:hypothetical protein